MAAAVTKAKSPKCEVIISEQDRTQISSLGAQIRFWSLGSEERFSSLTVKLLVPKILCAD